MSSLDLAAPVRMHNRRVLVAALVASVVMLFTAFAAAYLEHPGSRTDPVPLPGTIWANTAVLALSSALAELFRRRGRRVYLFAAMAVGLMFLVGQALVWLELRRAGVYLPTSPHASFLYLLTMVHGAHVVAALAALATAGVRPQIAGLCVGFWHFLGFVWLYVLFILKAL